ncbi:MAG: hypothetical protein V7609_624 [Verrucomicrobiota bacterium]
MLKDRLNAYVNEELATAQRLVTEVVASDGGPKKNLRLLYGIPLDAKVVYAESGGLSSIDCFPDDTTVILPIFPWSENDLRLSIGSLTRLRDLIETGRVFPILQHPPEYEHCDHLEFLFDRGTPSYFIRGNFAYSAILGIPAEVELTGTGIPALTGLNRLMIRCETVHQSWLKHLKRDPQCWEYRYRQYSLRDDQFYKRLHSSLCYRYASVALCVGPDNADDIISIFSPDEASNIFLHLHIFFDHVVCHGLGSDFVVRPSTPDGNDFRSSQQTGVTRPHELTVARDLTVPLPDKEDQYVRCLLREEHFLREIEFDLISAETLPGIQNQLNRQFLDYRRKIERVSKGQKYTEWTVGITLYIMSVGALLYGNLGGIGTAVAAAKFPQLAEIVAAGLRKLHRDKLASFAMDPQNFQ